jgi:peptidoglycan/xylan/chitin deacetylase (PgdA/CDA1 family)
VSDTPTFAEHVAELDKMYATRPLIRAVNFHSTPRSKADQYDRELANYAENFTSVNQNELDDYLVTGKWNKPKPGLIISIFEGYRNGYDVLLPIVEKHGFIAWFWVITGFINAPVRDQVAFALSHDIQMLTREYPDARYAMTWDELKIIDKKHVINCHSRSHIELATMPPVVRKEEIIGSQQQFKKHLGHPVRGFVSLLGPTYGHDPVTDKLIDEAGYDYVLSNFAIQRIHAKRT